METFQIQIALKGSKPKIWRRILVSSNLSLADFHLIIQSTMGWTNSHLHQFIKKRTYYLPDKFDTWEDESNVYYKKAKLKISDLLSAKKDKIIYEYDFGDSWEHEVLLESILTDDTLLKHPICLAGAMSCPPEDCGGLWGYSEMLEILKQPDHEEYESYLEWLDEDFDPEKFDIDEVNVFLKKKKFGLF